MITFVLLGSELTRIPTIGTILQVERSAPNASALYERRVSAAYLVETEYFSILDGGEDILLDEFESATLELCNKLTETGLDIGSTRESINGERGHFMHHNVICRTSAFKKLKIPKSGLYMFEPIVYPLLSKKGTIEHDVIAYNWIPTPGGAARWPETKIAYENSKRWQKGKPPLKSPAHLQYD